MLKRLLEFQIVLNALVAKVYQMRDKSGNKLKYRIPSLDFEKIEIIVEALAPLAELTKKLSLKDASVADILPIYRVFMRCWSPDETFENDEVSQIRQNVTIGLDSRMKKMKLNK